MEFNQTNKLREALRFYSKTSIRETGFKPWFSHLSSRSISPIVEISPLRRLLLTGNFSQYAVVSSFCDVSSRQSSEKGEVFRGFNEMFNKRE